MKQLVISLMSTLLLLFIIGLNTNVYAVSEEQCEELVIVVCMVVAEPVSTKQIVVYKWSHSSYAPDVAGGSDCASAIASVLKTGYCIRDVSTTQNHIYYTLVKYKLSDKEAAKQPVIPSK
ncbi:MAG: hypothetical protein HZB30_08340 [Nitrospirae bacterium]|nr:hypothetical protein [Nitrospirota bacterium]